MVITVVGDVYLKKKIIIKKWNLLGEVIPFFYSGEWANSDRMFMTLSKNGNILALGYPYDHSNPTGPFVKIYTLQNDSWTSIGIIYSDSINDFQNLFGSTVSLNNNGTILAIGDDSYNNNTGRTIIYQYINNNWVQKGNPIDGDLQDDFFSEFVELSGDGNRVVIGTYFKSFQSTKNTYIKVYEYNNNDWNQIGQTIILGELQINGDIYPIRLYSLSISGDGNNIIIGENYSYYLNNNITKIYEYTNNIWEQKGDDIEGENNNDMHGRMTSINYNGNIVIIGQPGYTDTELKQGRCRIFQYTNSQWIQIGQNIDGTDRLENIGFQVDIDNSGLTIAIAGDINRSNTKVFNYIDGTWIQKGSDLTGGYTLSLSGDGNRICTAAKNKQVELYEYN